MPEPTEPDDRVTKKVEYEHVASSGSSRQNIVVIIVLVVIALAIIGYIFMHMNR
jgi:flagellar basal body-associated protein FliL